MVRLLLSLYSRIHFLCSFDWIKVDTPLKLKVETRIRANKVAQHFYFAFDLISYSE